MDYLPSPESFYGSDLDKTSWDKQSPNSLYMYDQERHDMQNTLNGNGLFGSICQSATGDMAGFGVEPEFDLNPQYEKSNSLAGYFGQALMDGMLQNATLTRNDSSLSLGFSQEKANSSSSLLSMLDNSSQQGLKMGESGPTLTELNMVSSGDPLSLEDIESILSSEEEDKPQVSPKSLSGVDSVRQVPIGQNMVKSETVQKRTPPFYTTTATSTSILGRLTVSQPRLTATPVSNLFGIRPATNQGNVAVVPPISCGQSAAHTTTSPTYIKPEPIDTYEVGPNSTSCLHKMLSLPTEKSSVSPLSHCTSPPEQRQVMPVVGQTRAPPLGQQVKSESVEEKWKEIEKFIHDPDQATATSRKRKRNYSGGSSIDDSDMHARLGSGSYNSDDDSDSDADSDYSDSPIDESLTELAKKSKQYFWQYNVQAKGPKGTRLKLRIHDDDPHHPASFEDPVFDATSTSLVGIRHGGKARKGDGNEVTPNPRKLFQIGKNLYRLNKQINAYQLSNDMPASQRNKSRKEKNKLASRACRLKKKAQHEANKVKLTGLDTEQGELLEVIRLIWPRLKERAQEHMKGMVPSPGSSETLTSHLETLIKSQRKSIVAGNTTDYVNEVIAKVEDGDMTGGLPIRLRTKTDA